MCMYWVSQTFNAQGRIMPLVRTQGHIMQLILRDDEVTTFQLSRVNGHQSVDTFRKWMRLGRTRLLSSAVGSNPWSSPGTSVVFGPSSLLFHLTSVRTQKVEHCVGWCTSELCACVACAFPGGR